MNFAERNGFICAKPIQIKSMDDTLKNRLYNITMKFISPSHQLNEILEYVVDKMGYLSVSNNRENAQTFNNKFFDKSYS